MKSFYVAWSDEPDLKLAWSSETALFKLFPLGPLWRYIGSYICDVCKKWPILGNPPPPPTSPCAHLFYSQKWTIDIFCLKH